MPAEPIDQDYPIVLTTGRLGNQYLSGVQTRRMEGLHKMAPVPVAEIHPWLAGKIGLGVQDRIRITSRRGSLVFQVKVTEGIQQRTVFVPFHWGGDWKKEGPCLGWHRIFFFLPIKRALRASSGSEMGAEGPRPEPIGYRIGLYF